MPLPGARPRRPDAAPGRIRRPPSAIRALRLAAAAVVVPVALTGCLADAEDPPASGPSAATPAASDIEGVITETPTATQTSDDPTIAALQAVLDHNEQAISISEMVPALSPDHRLDATYETIRDRRDAEVTKLQSLLTKLGVPSPDDEVPAPEDAPTGPGLLPEADLEALQDKPAAAFNRAWVDAMITQHEGGLTMIDQVRREVPNPEATGLLQEIRDAKAADLAKLRQLRQTVAAA